jgi:hypothetical protein
MHNYRELNLPLLPLRHDFKFPKDTGDAHATFKINVEQSLNPELIKIFKELGITPKAMVFRTPPHNKCSIHVDGFLTHQQWGMNWAWGTDHLMSWWKPNDPKIKLENFKKTNASTPYLVWDDEDVTLIESVKITKPVIIKTGVPHRVENFSDTDRWCLTVRPAVPTNWNEALMIFKEYVVE